MFEYVQPGKVVCKFCRDFDPKGGGDYAEGKSWPQWKLDYLKRHITQKVHLDSVSGLRTKRTQVSLNTLLSETEEQKAVREEILERGKQADEPVKVLISDVLLAIDMDASMNSVQLIHKHMEKYTTVLDSWRGKNYAFVFVDCLAQVTTKHVVTAIQEAPFHTLIVDESTDVSTSKMLALYIKYSHAGAGSQETTFAGLIQLKSGTADAIHQAILSFYSEHNLDLQKMVMFTSDGASVMLGKKGGVATLLKRSIPHLIEQHCVAHREDLGIDDAWSGLVLMRDVETLLRTTYTMFSRSGTKHTKFEELAAAAEKDVIAFKQIHEVRWLSRHFAVEALVRNMDTLETYCEEVVRVRNDPIVRYILNTIQNRKYRIALMALEHLLRELANLCRMFQRKNLSVHEAHDLAKAKIKKIEVSVLAA